MAAHYLKRACDILKENFPNHAQTYVCLGDWSFYLLQSKYKWDQLEHAASEAMEKLGRKDPATVFVKYQLGKLLCRLHDPDQLTRSIAILNENLESRQKQDAHDYLRITEAMLSLGKAKIRCRDGSIRQEGLALMESAMKMLERQSQGIFGQDYIIAEVDKYIPALIDLQMYATAMDLLQKHMQRVLKAFGQNSNIEVSARLLQADCYSKTNNLRSAEDTLLIARDCVNKDVLDDGPAATSGITFQLALVMEQQGKDRYLLLLHSNMSCFAQSMKHLPPHIGSLCAMSSVPPQYVAQPYRCNV